MAAIPTSHDQANTGSRRIPEGHPSGAVSAGHPLPDKQGRQRLGCLYRPVMNHFLLLGAGFTRNWGGPLASEMFNLLIGRKPIDEMPVLRDALVRHRERGGFEAAFGEIQAEYERSRSPQSLAHLRGFQDAIAEVFSDLDGALSNATFEFQAPPDNSNELVKFLTAFDAIFSLNQDLMLERHYLDILRVSLASGNRWNGWEFPGMRV